MDDKFLYNSVDRCYYCAICNKKFNKKSHVASHWSVLHDSARKKPNLKGIAAWNKGLRKDTDKRVKKYANTISRKIQNKEIKHAHHIPTATERESTSIRMSLHNPGGKCKWFEVNGIKVQGTWERDIAIKLSELNIQWEKPSTNADVWRYETEGKYHSYAPDFYLPSLNIWLEIKGYWWGNDKIKMEKIKKTYPHRKLLIIEEEQYRDILKNILPWEVNNHG